MPEQTFEPLGIGQILDRSFRLYRQNFMRFLAVVVVVQIPIVLLQLGIGRYAMSDNQDQQRVAQAQERWSNAIDRLDEPGGLEEMEAASDEMEEIRDEREGPEQMVGIGIVVGLLGWLAQILAGGALAKSIAEAYLGRSPTVGQVYKAVMPRFWSLIVASVLLVIIITVMIAAGAVLGAVLQSVPLMIIGVVIMSVPAIIVGIRMYLASQIVVIEGVGGVRALGRSWSLVRGYAGKLFLLMILLILIGVAVGIGVGVATWPLTMMAKGQGTVQVLKQAIESFANMLITPVTAGAIVLLYFDLRIRKEAFDLEMLAEQMGAQPSESAYEPPSQPPLEP